MPDDLDAEELEELGSEELSSEERSSFEEVPEALEIPEVPTDEKHIVFSILGKLYALPSRYISEIALYETVYPIPLMPAYVLGIINRYSVPYILFDIGRLLTQTPMPQGGKILVFKDEIDRVAFLIDDVIDIADIPLDKIIIIERNAESHDAAEAIGASFQWNGGDVFVLDVRRVLSHVTNDTAG